MKIAVVGAGFAGLAQAITLKEKHPSFDVHLFDPKESSLRTSALGQLLYPFVGMHSKLNFRGVEGFKKTQEFLKKAEAFASSPLFQTKLLLKLAHSEKQLLSFKVASQTYPEIKLQENTPFHKPGILIESALQVDPLNYLKALENWAKSLNVVYSKSQFTEENEIDFDQIIYCTGAQSKELFTDEKFALLKGQALILKKPEGFTLPYNLIDHHLHFIPSLDGKTIYVGNTFEREFKTQDPCKETATKLIWPKLTTLFPNFTKGQIIDVQAGLRINTPSRLPIIKRISEKKLLITGMGAKGLLYHVDVAEAAMEDCFSSKRLTSAAKLKKNTISGVSIALKGTMRKNHLKPTKMGSWVVK